MSDVVLGRLLDGDAQRDAIHVAVAPVEASCLLAPGAHVGPVSARVDLMGISDKPIGIVDPFLKAMVQPGERFWLFLYQNTVTGMRHHWEHPSFPDASPSLPPEDGVVSDYEQGCWEDRQRQLNRSMQWIETYAEDFGLEYQDLMTAADNYLSHGEYLIEGGRFEGERISDDFWIHYQNVTGKAIDPDSTGNFFSCSC